jgi:hypothetical protein
MSGRVPAVIGIAKALKRIAVPDVQIEKPTLRDCLEERIVDTCRHIIIAIEFT